MQDINPILEMIERNRKIREATGSALTQYSEKVDRDLRKTCHGDWSHEQVAGNVRMLMRNDLDHESICTTARDRIIWLARRVEELEAQLHASVSDNLTDIVLNTKRSYSKQYADKKFEYVTAKGEFNGLSVDITVRIRKCGT
jgi:hypothetical protein